MVLGQLLGVNITPSYFQFYRKFLNVMGEKKTNTNPEGYWRCSSEAECVPSVARPEKEWKQEERREGRREAGRERKDKEKERKEAGRGQGRGEKRKRKGESKRGGEKRREERGRVRAVSTEAGNVRRMLSGY